MKKLHPIQQQILNILKHNLEQDITMGYIKNVLDLSSTGVVGHHIAQLEKKGLLRRNPNNPRDYHILENKPEEEIVYLPVYSSAQCGPKGLIASSEPQDRLPVATRILGFPSHEAFAVIARGTSMEPRIHNNDYLIARKVNDRYAYENYHGKIVLCVNGEECLIKKIYYDKTSNHVLLQSLNPHFAPVIAQENFWIEAEIRGIFTYSA